MNVSREWYERYLARRQSASPKLEQHHRHEPLAEAQGQAQHPVRYVVSVTSFRRRLLDEDNLCEKYHVDAMRYAGILPSDAPGITRIAVNQVKVTNKAEERTEITIEHHH